MLLFRKNFSTNCRMKNIMYIFDVIWIMTRSPRENEERTKADIIWIIPERRFAFSLKKKNSFTQKILFALPPSQLV